MSSPVNTSVRLPHRAFALLRDLVHERTGLYFEDTKSDIFVGKLSPLVVKWGFDSILDYYYFLKDDPGSADEWRKLFDALTVQESFFWREMDQIRALVDEIVPHYFITHPRHTLNIWSAACAAGEEPLTIAMALHEAGWFDRARIEIHASDASPRAVEAARKGVYRERSLRNLPPGLKEKYFACEDGLWQPSNELRSRVHWRVANLTWKPTSHWPRWRRPSSSVGTYSSTSPSARLAKQFVSWLSGCRGQVTFSSVRPNRY